MNSTRMISYAHETKGVEHTFTISTDAKYLNDTEQEQEYGNPYADI
jgi:hypothetical protein